MSRLLGFFISGEHRRSLRLLLWLPTFLIMLTCAAWVVAEQVSDNMREEIGRNLIAFEQLRTNVLSTFDTMEQRLSAEPCSPAFLDEMRRVAFLPDGINELLYISGNAVQCSVNNGRLEPPEILDLPEIEATNAFNVAFWLDRDLSFLSLDGMVGTIARRGNLGMIVPAQQLPATGPRWMEQELVLRATEGRWWHRSGVPGIYSEALQAGQGGLFRPTFFQMSCDPAGVHCIAGRADTANLLSLGWATISVIVLVVGVLAAWAVQQVHGFIERHWSFEARFLRRLEKGSVVCMYQPLLHLPRDLVTGCEVLARWRDLDGTIVPPDRFLPIIERHGLTERFTAMVVANAYSDLMPRLPEGVRLQVNFNIFPQDLDAAKLIAIFAPFLTPSSPIDVVVELVETAEVRPETAQVEIERLRAAGIRTYIDDFGAGYSSMHNLAELSIDGVKLDRSFAMAPDQSVMARMLDHAIELVQASGRALVVEGVETPERLAALKACGRVDYAQGYGIARPLLIDAFMAFLADHGPRPASRPRLVA